MLQHKVFIDEVQQQVLLPTIMYQVYEKIDQFFYLATKIMENEKKINMHTKYLQFMN
jgi:hypothetical protein